MRPWLSTTSQRVSVAVARLEHMFESDPPDRGAGHAGGVPSGFPSPDGGHAGSLPDGDRAGSLPDGGHPGSRLASEDWIDAADMVVPEAPVDPRIVPTGPAGEQLAAKAPGSELAYLLEHCMLDGAEDYDVVEVVAAWQRMSAWAAAGAARAAAALSERPSMNPAWPDAAGEVSETNVTGDELAIRLGCSRWQARLLVRDGRAYQGALAWTGDALARGEIDPTKARILVNELVDLPVPLAVGVQEAVLEGAAYRSPSQLTKDVARSVLTLDPEGSRARHEVAAKGRRVDRPRALPNGMAGLWAVLPAVGATRLDNTLDVLARGARTAGDSRTLDQLRADLLVDLATGEVPGRASPVAGDPAVLHGDGAVSAGGDAVPMDGSVEAAAPEGTAPDASPALDGGRGSAPRRTQRRTPRRALINVTVPMSTLLGGDEPAELAGYGPIHPDAARALSLDGPWRRLVTDPVDGRVLNVGRTRYRPPTEIAEHVRARDKTCARPGCGADAASCDLDHTVEFHRHGGETRDANLEPLCRRDHAVKTDGGFRLAQVAPGVFEWETPTGHRYRVQPGVDAPYQPKPRYDVRTVLGREVRIPLYHPVPNGPPPY